MFKKKRKGIERKKLNWERNNIEHRLSKKCSQKNKQGLT